MKNKARVLIGVSGPGEKNRGPKKRKIEASKRKDDDGSEEKAVLPVKKRGRPKGKVLTRERKGEKKEEDVGEINGNWSGLKRCRGKKNVGLIDFRYMLKILGGFVLLIVVCVFNDFGFGFLVL